ncbi:MAG: hypothetical protein U0527_04165 [Candidatus Eisenbacteria bacterium]
MEQRAAQRSSAGPVSVGALLQAKEELEQRAGAGTRDGGLWGWEWLGPSNVGGRILTILTRSGDQNRLWVGAASGGIWTTTNGGTTWSPVDDFLPSLTVTSLVSDPASAGVMYAATGEGTFSSGNKNAERSPGAGVFRSTDFGVTWDQLGATSTWSYVNRLAHHPTLSGILWAATDQPTGVWKSSDSGASWTQTLTPNSATTQVIVHSTTPTRVFVGTSPNGAGTNGHVYRSTDGGANFTDLTVGGSNNLPTSTGRCEIGLGSNTTVYVLMDRNGGELYRSASNGDLGTWTQQPTTPALFGAQGFYDNVIWVDPTNSDRIVIGGVDIYRSTNHGNTWQWISNGNGWINNTSAHPDQHCIVQRTGWDGVNSNTVYFGNDGGLYKTNNVFAADTLSGWTNLNNGLGVTQFYSVASSATGSVIVGGTQDNGLPYRNGSGTTWNRTPLYLDGASSAIDPTNSNIVYGLTQYGHVWKSTNGGASYSDATIGYLYGLGTALFNAPFELDPNNSTISWTGGVQIWKSTNSAGSWSAKRNTISGTPYVSAISVKPGNSNEVWIGYTDGTVSRTTNGGTNWTNVDAGSPALPDRWVMDIEASPFFANEAVVVLAGYSTQQIWATFDGGATWSDRSGGGSDVLPSIQMNCVSYHPVNSDWLYAGSDLGVFASNDFGLHWNVTPAWGNNDGPAYVEVDDLIFYQDRLLVGTWGRGIYRARPLSVVYVDLANVGTEDGTQTHPYNTVTEGINAMGNGTTLSIKTATYTEGAKTFNRAGLVVATGGTVTVR